MRRAHFDLLVSNVRQGTGSDALFHLMATATDLVKADVAFLGLVSEGRVKVLAGYQLPFYAKREWQVTPKISASLSGPIFCGDAKHAGLEAAFPDDWSFLLSAPLRMGDGDGRLVLACVGYGAQETVSADALDRLQAIAGSCTFQLRLLAELLVRDQSQGAFQPQPVTFVAEQPAAYQPEPEPSAAPTEVTAEFILKTLVQSRRINTRNGVSYTTTAKWRTAIKDWQIVALKALKKQPPAALLEAAAEKILQAAHDLVGKGGFTSVVSVPCGHSGPRCFSSLLAQAIATMAGVRCLHLFVDMFLTGSSHPKTNATRPKMRIVGPVDPSERVLLVDDVATSGAHIAEATTLLRQAGCAVLPIAWIGA